MTTTFHGLDLLTAPGLVFTPRASTEALVDAALARLDDQPATVADVGTGSGAIAVALAVAKPEIEVWATDTSEAAVELARANAERHGVGSRVHVLRGNLLEPVPESVDLVVANLPYLPETERRPAMRSARAAPAAALPMRVSCRWRASRSASPGSRISPSR